MLAKASSRSSSMRSKAFVAYRNIGKHWKHWLRQFFTDTSLLLKLWKSFEAVSSVSFEGPHIFILFLEEAHVVIPGSSGRLSYGEKKRWHLEKQNKPGRKTCFLQNLLLSFCFQVATPSGKKHNVQLAAFWSRPEVLMLLISLRLLPGVCTD